VCPWNKYAVRSDLPDFDARAAYSDVSLLALWDWPEEEFLRRTEGSPIRRIGWERWRRNLAVAMGNALRHGASPQVAQALRGAREAASVLVREHIDWALSMSK
jgi:epoxyqueuosine reductase